MHLVDVVLRYRRLLSAAVGCCRLRCAALRCTPSRESTGRGGNTSAWSNPRFVSDSTPRGAGEQVAGAVRRAAGDGRWAGAFKRLPLHEDSHTTRRVCAVQVQCGCCSGVLSEVVSECCACASKSPSSSRTTRRAPLRQWSLSMRWNLSKVSGVEKD